MRPQLSFPVYWGGWACVMGDREAIKESGLYDLVEKLPGLLYCIGDCAYTPTEHLTPIYGSYSAKKPDTTIITFTLVNCGSESRCHLV